MEDKNSTIGVRTWIEINVEAIKSNIAAFRSIIDPKTKLCAVVKSNAYGHGLVDFSKTVESLTDWIAVDSIMEGLRLRKEGIVKPVLVLGYTLPEMLEKAIEADISVAISHFEYFKAIEKLSSDKKLKVHVKIDSGMHRQGFQENEIEKMVSELNRFSGKIDVEGIFTHFAAAKNPSFPQATQAQLSIFKKCVEAVRTGGFSPIVHASATGGTILFPDAHFDMVRIGIGLYGLWPSLETKAYAEKRISLRPVMSWKTIVGEIKKNKKR